MRKANLKIAVNDIKRLLEAAQINPDTLLELGKCRSVPEMRYVLISAISELNGAYREPRILAVRMIAAVPKRPQFHPNRRQV